MPHRRPTGPGARGLVCPEARLFLRDAPEVTSKDPRLRAPLHLPAGVGPFPGVPSLNAAEVPPAGVSLGWEPVLEEPLEANRRPLGPGSKRSHCSCCHGLLRATLGGSPGFSASPPLPQHSVLPPLTTLESLGPRCQSPQLGDSSGSCLLSPPSRAPWKRPQGSKPGAIAGFTPLVSSQG